MKLFITHALLCTIFFFCFPLVAAELKGTLNDINAEEQIVIINQNSYHLDSDAVISKQSNRDALVLLTPELAGSRVHYELIDSAEKSPRVKTLIILDR